MLYIRVQSSQFFSHKNPLEKWLMLKIVSHEIYAFCGIAWIPKYFKEKIYSMIMANPRWEY